MICGTYQDGRAAPGGMAGAFGARAGAKRHARATHLPLWPRGVPARAVRGRRRGSLRAPRPRPLRRRLRGASVVEHRHSRHARVLYQPIAQQDCCEHRQHRAAPLPRPCPAAAMMKIQRHRLQSGREPQPRLYELYDVTLSC